MNWTVLFLLAFAIVAYTVAIYAQSTLEQVAESGSGLGETYAGQPLWITSAFYIHITASALALGVGPFQFADTIRRKRPAVHRWLGRFVLIAVAIGSAASLVMSATVNSEQINGFFGFGSLAVVWVWVGWRGYKAIREKDVQSHHAWMIRFFALTYAGVTLRAWLGGLTLVQIPFLAPGVDPDAAIDIAYAAVPFLCWLPNLIVAEWLIRRRGLPSYRLTDSPTSPEAVAARRAMREQAKVSS